MQGRYPRGYDFPIDDLFWGAVIFLGLFLVCFFAWKFMRSPDPGDDTEQARDSIGDKHEPDWDHDANATEADIPPSTIAGLLPDNWQTAYRTDRRDQFRQHGPPRQ